MLATTSSTYPRLDDYRDGSRGGEFPAELKCDHCGRAFWRHASMVRFQSKAHPEWKVYCSKRCHGRGMRQPDVELPCAGCGRTFKRNASRVKQSRKQGARMFCSRECGGRASMKEDAAMSKVRRRT